MSLIADGLHVALSGRTVLAGVALTARTGALTAIIGPNGSGKTTLLRCLTGEIAPVSGRITLNGRDLAGQSRPSLARQRAVMPQHSALSFPFTVSEIVGIGLDQMPLGPRQRDALIRDALAQVGLPGHAGRLWQDLSGGEQQRVQLARALAQIRHPGAGDGPRWLLLDEPVSSLDIGHQLSVMRLAAGHARSGGGTVAILHDLNLTAMFADHVVLLAEGRVLGEGPPHAVLTDRLLAQAYGCALRTCRAPDRGVWLVPQATA